MTQHEDPSTAEEDSTEGWPEAAGDQPSVEDALLYRTRDGWRFSIRERPEAVACGKLEGVAASDSIEAVARVFEQHLRSLWRVEGVAEWLQTRPDWWQVSFR